MPISSKGSKEGGGLPAQNLDHATALTEWGLLKTNPSQISVRQGESGGANGKEAAAKSAAIPAPAMLQGPELSGKGEGSRRAENGRMGEDPEDNRAQSSVSTASKSYPGREETSLVQMMFKPPGVLLAGPEKRLSGQDCPGLLLGGPERRHSPIRKPAGEGSSKSGASRQAPQGGTSAGKDLCCIVLDHLAHHAWDISQGSVLPDCSFTCACANLMH